MRPRWIPAQRWQISRAGLNGDYVVFVDGKVWLFGLALSSPAPSVVGQININFY